MDNPNYVPTPQEIEDSVSRIYRLNQIVFEVWIDTWRKVQVFELRPIRNERTPALSLLTFRCRPLIPTPMLMSIPARLAVTEAGFNQHIASVIDDNFDVRDTRERLHYLGSRGMQVPFRETTQEARDWLRLKIAQAQGARFREHSILTPDGGEYIYTKD